jgi:hypothetical protein
MHFPPLQSVALVLLYVSTLTKAAVEGVPSCVAGYCISADYNKFEVPTFPTYVRIKLRVNDIIAVSDTEFSVTMNTYVMLSWYEPRIFRNDVNNTDKWSSVDPEVMKKVVCSLTCDIL